MAVRLSGLVKNWSVVGGYGFIDGGRSEYFCHRSQLQNCFSLEPSDRVTFIAAPSEKKGGKMNAKEVHLVDGRAATERIVAGGEFSGPSTVPVKSKEVTSRAALPSHESALARSSTGKLRSTGVSSQTKPALEAPKLTGKSAEIASSFSRGAIAQRQVATTATAPAKVAAPSQGEGAVLPKLSREGNVVSSQEKVQERQEDKAGLKPAAAAIQRENKQQKCIEEKQVRGEATVAKDDVKDDAAAKTLSSEGLDTMSATTGSLASAESIRDSDSEPYENESEMMEEEEEEEEDDEEVEECLANLATVQLQGAKAPQTASMAAKKSTKKACEVEVKKSFAAAPAKNPWVAEDVVVDCWEELLSPEPSPVHAHAEASEDQVFFALAERKLHASAVLPLPDEEEGEDEEVVSRPITSVQEVAVNNCEALARHLEQRSAVNAPAEDPEKDGTAVGAQVSVVPSQVGVGPSHSQEADADALGSRQANAAVLSEHSANDWQDASGYAYQNFSQPWQPLGAGVSAQQSDYSTYSYGNMPQALQTPGGGYYRPVPQTPMMMMSVPAPGFGCVAPQPLWPSPAVPVLYIDPSGGVHPLQQMMVPVAVPISSMNYSPVEAALPPTL